MKLGLVSIGAALLALSACVNTGNKAADVVFEVAPSFVWWLL